MATSMSVPPSGAIFERKWPISNRRWAESEIAQKLCVKGDTQTRKRARQKNPDILVPGAPAELESGTYGKIICLIPGR
jgi:hypothetical protein